MRYGTIRVDGGEKEVLATDTTLLTSLVDIAVSSGDPAESAGAIYDHEFFLMRSYT